MKIGLFTDTYWPQVNGVATSVLMLKNHLEQMGHVVHVFTTTDPDAPADEHNVHRVYSVPFVSKRRFGSFYNPRLRRQINRLQLDVIHTHTEFSLGRFGRAITKAMDIPHIHTMHTIYEDYTHFVVKLGKLDYFAKAAARRMSSGFCNSADQVIVPTGKVKTMMKHYGVEADKMHVIPTGIDLEKFQKHYEPAQLDELRQQYGIQNGDFVLSYIGRVSIEKNISELLHSLQHYLPSHPHVKVMIVGDGPARQNLEELTEYLDIGSQVIFTGEQPWDNIGIFYHLGHIFINASQSEAQGLTYIEALASGLPVVVKADPCIENVVQDGVNGFAYVKQQQFLQQVDQLIHDESLRQQMASAAVASAEKFSAENYAKTVLELYQSMLTRKVVDDAQQTLS